MEQLIEASVATTRWLQENYPQLEGFMLLLAVFGRFEFYLVIIPLIYWCIDKKNGKYLAYLMSVSLVLNSFFKHALRGPRPYWFDASLSPTSEPYYGVPSGHSQGAMVFYLYIAYWLRRGWVWQLCLFMIFLMGLSRIYLGVHYLHDVIIGYLLGFSVFAGFLIWKRYFHERYRNRILGQRLLIVFIVPLVFGLLYFIMRQLTGAAEPASELDPFVEVAELASLKDMATALGSMAGLGVGFVLEASRVYFLVAGSVGKRLLRFLFGIAITLLLWRGLGLLFDVEPLWLAIPLRMLRFFIAGLWVSYYAPYFFIRLRLADAGEGPEAELSVSSGSIMRG